MKFIERRGSGGESPQSVVLGLHCTLEFSEKDTRHLTTKQPLKGVTRYVFFCFPNHPGNTNMQRRLGLLEERKREISSLIPPVPLNINGKKLRTEDAIVFIFPT